jgi:hypothetical protein
MTFFGRPLNQIFNASVATSAGLGFTEGALESYLFHRKGDDHPIRSALKQGVLWGSVDAGLEIGLNAFFPGARGHSAFQSAMIDLGLQGGAGFATGYAQARMSGDEHAIRRGLLTSAEWGLGSAIEEFGVSAMFPGARNLE